MRCDFSIGEKSIINGSFRQGGSTTESYSVPFRTVRGKNDAGLKGNQLASPANLPMETLTGGRGCEYPRHRTLGMLQLSAQNKQEETPTHIPSQPRSDVTPPIDYYRNLRLRMKAPLLQTATVESTISIADEKGGLFQDPQRDGSI